MVCNNPRAKGVLLGITCAFAPAVAWAQVAGGLLPALGTGYSSGDLRGSVESVLPGAPTVNLGAGWHYTASVGVDIGLTQTSFGDARQSGTQFTTIISPSLNLAGDTRLLTVNLGYSPTLGIYGGGGPNQTYVSQNLNASATATVVPETLFVDARALAFQTLRFGGAQFASNQFAASNDLVQTYSVGASVRYDTDSMNGGL